MQAGFELPRQHRMTLDLGSFCILLAATAGVHHHTYVAPGNQTQAFVNATKTFCQSNGAVFLARNILAMWYFVWIALTLILVCFCPPSLPPSNKHTNTNHRLGFTESLIFLKHIYQQKPKLTLRLEEGKCFWHCHVSKDLSTLAPNRHMT